MGRYCFSRGYMAQVTVASLLGVAATLSPVWANDHGAKPQKYNNEITVFFEPSTKSWDANPEIAAIGAAPNTDINWRITTPGFVFKLDSFEPTNARGQFGTPVLSSNDTVLTVPDHNGDSCTYHYTLYVYDSAHPGKGIKVDPQIKNGSGVMDDCDHKRKKKPAHRKR